MDGEDLLRGEGSHGELGDHAQSQDLVGQLIVFARINDVDAGAERGDGIGLSSDGSPMCSGVDPAR